MLEDLALIIKIAFSRYSLLAYALFGLFLLLLKRIAVEPKPLNYTRPSDRGRQAPIIKSDVAPHEGNDVQDAES